MTRALGTVGSDALVADEARRIAGHLVAGHLIARCEALRGARILITGGTGFLGSWMLAVLEALDERCGLGLELLVVSRDPEAFRQRLGVVATHRAVRYLNTDVRAVPAVGRLTHIIHGAGDPVAAAEPASRLDAAAAIVDGTRRITELAAQSGAGRLLLISSGAVYGSPQVPEDGIPEDCRSGPDGLDPRHAYHEAKRWSETWAVLHGERHGYATISARGFSFIGPWLAGHFAVAQFLRDAQAGGPIVINGDGTTIRSYQYAADAAGWMVAALLAGRPGIPYHIGSDQPVTLRHLAERIAAACASSPAVVVRAEATAGLQSKRYFPATVRTARELEVGTWTDLDTAIRQTLACQGVALRPDITLIPGAHP